MLCLRTPRARTAPRRKSGMSYFEKNFGLDDTVFTRVIGTALASGGDYCDLFFQQQSHNVIGLEDEQVNRAFRSTDLGVGIRVIKGETTGYAFCEDFEQESGGSLRSRPRDAGLGQCGRKTRADEPTG